MRYVALLRGINLGGNVMVKMEDLRKVFEGLGFENVASYINSGNLAFDARLSSPGLRGVSSPHVSKGSADNRRLQLEASIEKAIENDFGKPVPVMVREQKDIYRILKHNPFDGQYGSHKEMHVLFLKEKMSTDLADRLSDAALPGERYAVAGREIYCHFPQGFADSLLTKMFIEKKLKRLYTARNWRTVTKIAEM